MFVYVDDIAVMSKERGDLIADLSETFANLRGCQMKLNPTKSVFGAPAGKILGFIVSQRSIEVNPERIKAIQNIERPTCLKDIQRLTGSAVAVSRFIRRLGDKALPLYKLLKKSDNFVAQRRQRQPWHSLSTHCHMLQSWRLQRRRNHSCFTCRQPIW